MNTPLEPSSIEVRALHPLKEPVSFLLGMGAQKSGSTWLFKFLSDHPEAGLGELKEYGFWDNLFGVGGGLRQRNYTERRDNLASRFALSGAQSPSLEEIRRLRGLELALELMGSPEKYLQHFHALAKRRPVRLVADITPSYALLNSSQLGASAKLLRSAGFSPKPVFVMRDPIARVSSAFSMKLRRAKQKPGAVSARRLERDFLDFAHDSGTFSRTSYRKTIESLDTTFGPQHVFYGLYEKFFSLEEISRLLTYLEVSWREPPLDTKINRSGFSYRPSPRAQKILREIYADTYEFCLERFPESALDKLWRI